MTSHLRRLALGTVLPAFEGTTAPPWLLDLLREGLGGVILFGRNIVTPEQVAALVRQILDVRPDAVVGIDEEGGDVTRIHHDSGSPYPGNRVLSEHDDLDATRAVGRGIGAELRELGVNFNLAPIGDYVTDGHSPLTTRSFGRTPRHNAEHAAAWVEGLQSAGVAACLKHYPGLGGSLLDSHLALGRVAAGHAEFTAEHLPTFTRGARANVASMMTAHVVVDCLDPAAPTTLSETVISRLLRDEIGYDGVVISDALEMHGVLNHASSLPAAAVGALRAGVDALCLGAEQYEDATRAVVDAIVAAAESGELTVERLEEADRRIRTMARDYPGTPGLPGSADTSAERSIGRAAAWGATRVEGDVSIAGGGVRLVTFDDRTSIAAGPVPWGIARELREAGVAFADHVLSPPIHDLPDLSDAGPTDVVVAVVRDLPRHPESAEVFARLRVPRLIVVDMGYPGTEYPRASGVIRTFGASRASAAAAVRALTALTAPTRAGTTPIG
ncbi:glycoside hydrolase family 3 N-terminal domain-containing protein [Spongiactinospora sp. TRM90649]|uniref:glycoside hydrolase family 3 N-terminal domain-containing protein n=1 Tax=Spongiactinospora sp. TRM90649 TaxID=3031114 RepID=UPI0023F9FFF6|nr:glycoside hydrolase family 3 N-terminal domain-containing protein [Spongiactinospora sp. TRM90649]MDF5754767.1 glycoside hydrolase family 3 N-terminal domain-containing protein [Spongiactinospora sp. TRM90649]